MSILSRSTLLLGIAAACMSLAATCGATTVFECIDADGNATFMKACPPGTKPKGEYRLTGINPPSATDEDIARDHPVTLYVVDDCDACDLVRMNLEKRSVPFSEKNVTGDADMQAELEEKSGGLTVPAVLIGEEVVSGYSKAALEAKLNEVGYP